MLGAYQMLINQDSTLHEQGLALIISILICNYNVLLSLLYFVNVDFSMRNVFLYENDSTPQRD